MRLLRADVLWYFTVFTGRVTKSLIFHPAIAGSISASHFAARTRKNTPGPSPGPGASKTSLGRQKMQQNTEKQPNTPLSLGLRSTWLPGGSGGLPSLDEYEHWVCYGAGGWADADIHLENMLGSFRNRFGIILE